MRASRLLSILITLQLKGRVTARELAERFEVSRRTILRDVDELSAAGVPIYADRGAQGGFSLHAGYRTDLTGLNAPERGALFLLGLPTAAAELGLAAAARTARLKVAAAAPPGSRALDVAERFHLDPADWYRRGDVAPQLRAVAEAVWSGARLRIDYESWRARRWRDVDPLGLVLKGGNWYLVADAGRGPAIFRLAAILDAEALDQRFDRPARFDLAVTWRRLVERFERELHRGEARIRIAASAEDRLDRLGHLAAERIRAASPDGAGRRTATVPIEGIAHAAGLLGGYADEVEVLDPPELREELRRRAARVVALYAGGP